ncbi:MAG: hypothetical protein JSW07_03585, partial [bacterium]
MVGKVIYLKFISIITVLILLLSGFSAIIQSGKIVDNAKAESTWIQTSESDFKNGTLDNLTIEGNGIVSKLKLSKKSIPFDKWTEFEPATKPSERYLHKMANICGTEKILLFGGFNVPSETWIFNLSDNKWYQQYPKNYPNSKSRHAMASIWGTKNVVMFGDGLKTWIYNYTENNWTEKYPINEPTDKAKHSMSTIWGTDKVLLFGGWISGNETWIYDLSENNWTRKYPTNAPSSRENSKMASLYGTDEVLLYGGFSGGGNDETWIYNLTKNSWARQYPTNKPIIKDRISLASIWGTDNVIIFGNTDNYTWKYDYSDNDWKSERYKQNPTARSYSAMASFWGIDKVLFFGGISVSDYDDTWIYYDSLYNQNGTFVSESLDTGSKTYYKTLTWNDILTEGSKIEFQLRTADTESNLLLKPFIGPDGTEDTNYTFSPSSIWSGHTGDRWIQFKAYLKMGYADYSPTLKDISIAYNCFPVTNLIAPINNSIITFNQPIFTWNYTDIDSEQQVAFQVHISDDSSFDYVVYDSGEQITTEQKWQFPNGTSYSEISDGTWYWKVRTKD